MAKRLAVPLAFTPLAVTRPWGGDRARRVAELPEVDSDEPVGEWWILSARSELASRVSDGPFAGMSLAELTERFSGDLLGSAAAAESPRPKIFSVDWMSAASVAI